MGEPEFSPARLIDRLSRFPAMLAALLEGVGVQDARRRSPEGAWSIVEIVCHLCDEEREDFPSRLRALLEDPQRDWPPIDPEGWAVTRRYIERDPGERLVAFTAMRERNMEWVRAWADAADWGRMKRHPLGDLHAGDLLAAWCDHDLLHARQVLKRLHELTQRDAGVYSTLYAGEWKG